MKVKQKTKKSVSKRMSRTNSGEIKRKHAYRSHLAHNKTTKQKRHSRKDTLVSSADKKRYDQLL
ncbi:50S ribosomal protein L35 [Malacoplasma muris]|uniref:50S ribosomal protein L35 n=1 Tax=Malacoplasma muris TaxID=2119 RepID=UPI00398F5A48